MSELSEIFILIGWHL